MKKILALVLAAMMVLSCGAMMFTVSAEGATNVAPEATYEIVKLYQQQKVSPWGWSDNPEDAVYIDETGSSLTDGEHVADPAAYSDPAWVAVSGAHPEFKPELKPCYVLFKLKETTDVGTIIISVGNVGNAGIEESAAITAQASDDGVTFGEEVVGAYVDGVPAPGTEGDYKITLNEKANYVKVNFYCKAYASAAYKAVEEGEREADFLSELGITSSNAYWNFFDEIEIYNDGVVEEEGPITVKVTDGSLEFDKEKLALLNDGDFVDGATSFSAAGLVSFKNTGFEHTAGVDAAVEATMELTIDLGEVKNVNGVSMGFYLDSNSMVALPTELQFYISEDGVNYYAINAEKTIAIPEEPTECSMVKLTADFSTRGTFFTKYVKAVATLKNGWFFISELNVNTNEENFCCSPAGPYAYDDNINASTGTGIFTSEVGEIDLSINDPEIGYFKNAQIILATFDEEVGAYKIEYSKVNPWPDGHSGTVELADDQILVSISTGGAYGADKTVDNLTNLKWIARGLVPGDYVLVDVEANEFYFYKPEQFTTPAPNPDPTPDPEPVDTYVEEIAAMVGDANADAKFDVALDSVVSEDGKTVTVTLSIENVSVELTGVVFKFCYDAERMTLTTPKKSDNSLDFVAEGFGDKWENLTKEGDEAGVIEFQMIVADDLTQVLNADGTYTATFTFELNEGFDKAGAWVPCENLRGMMTGFQSCLGNGNFIVAEIDVVEESSEDESSEETSTPTPTGDAGIILFAVMGVIAVAGAATVIKVRH